MEPLRGPEGILWIGTRGGGLNCLRNTSVLAYGEAEGLPKGSVWGIHEDRLGAVWIASERGGVLRLKDGRITEYTTRHGLLSNEISAVVEDSAGDIWIGTDAGLNRIHMGRLSSLPAGKNVHIGLVRALFAARDGSLWIGTMGSGVSRYRNGSFTQFTKRDGLPDDWVRVVLEDRKGTMWFGTNRGLVCLRDGRFTRYGASEGLPQESITPCTKIVTASCGSAPTAVDWSEWIREDSPPSRRRRDCSMMSFTRSSRTGTVTSGCPATRGSSRSAAADLNALSPGTDQPHRIYCLRLVERHEKP